MREIDLHESEVMQVMIRQYGPNPKTEGSGIINASITKYDPNYEMQKDGNEKWNRSKGKRKRLTKKQVFRVLECIENCSDIKPDNLSDDILEVIRPLDITPKKLLKLRNGTSYSAFVNEYQSIKKKKENT
jgi:hypothetical protein